MFAYILSTRSGYISVQNLGHSVSAYPSTRLFHAFSSKFKTIAHKRTTLGATLPFSKLFLVSVPALSRARAISSTATRLATSDKKTNDAKGRSKGSTKSSSTKTKSKVVVGRRAATPRMRSTKDTITEKPKITIQEHQPPKKPASPYLRFHMQRWRALDSSSNGKEIARQNFLTVSVESGKLWNAMSDQEKQPYIDEYEKLFDGYRVTLGDYWKKTDRSTLLALNKLRRAKGKRLFHPIRDVKEPIRPFPRFLKDYRESNSIGHLNSREVISTAAVEWRKLSDEQRLAYNERYKRDLVDFKASKSTSMS